MRYWAMAGLEFRASAVVSEPILLRCCDGYFLEEGCPEIEYCSGAEHGRNSFKIPSD
jgi:hypothetical protein